MSEVKKNQDQLRIAAEARLAHAAKPKLKPKPKPKPKAQSKPKQLPARKLLHELEVHQIELEMQNEALRQTQVELDSSCDRYADFFEFSPVGYLNLNQKGMIDEINLTATALLGVERSKLLHRRFSSHVVTEDRDRWQRFFLDALERDEKQTCELAIKRGAGTHFYAQLDCLRLIKAEKTLRMVLNDISWRRAGEAKIQRLTQFYNALAQCNQVIAHTAAEEELLAEICNIVTQVGGMKVAWFGFLDDAGRQVVPFVSCGDGAKYLTDIQISMDPDSPLGRGPTATSIRENQPYWCQDFMHDPLTAPWHERGARYGWRASAALPLHRNGVVIGAFILYSDVLDAFDEAMRKLLVEMAENIGRALDKFAYDAERKKDEHLLQESEARYRSLFKNLFNGYAYCKMQYDDNGRPVDFVYVEVNAAFERLTGLKNVIGISVSAVIPGILAQSPELIDIYGRVAATGIPEVFDLDSKLLGILFHISVYSTEQGYFVAIFEDITERKRAEQKLAHYARDMSERAKEASCLRDITALLTKKEWGLDFIIDSCVRRIPGGWFDPANTCARVILDDKIFESLNFKQTAWKLSAKIPLTSKGSGVVEVFYTGDVGEIVEKPFLDEEHDLINSIAIQVGQSLERRWADEHLELQRNNFRRILDAIPDGIYIASRNYDMVYVNLAIERESGKLDAQKCYAYLYGRTEPCPWCKNEEVFKDKTVRWQMHSDKTGKDYDMLDAPIVNSDGTVSKFEMIHDITYHKLAEAQIRSLSFYDALTQLPNRRMLNERFELAMAASKRSGQYGAAMFLDLNNFKPLNDVYGHKMGDLLLVEVAKRLKSCMREIDTVARFGGDEFVVILSELDADKAKSRVQAGMVAEKIRTMLTEPYTLTVQPEGKAKSTIEHQCTSSIGVALFIGHEASQDAIIKWADHAMYQAKGAGRNQIRFYGETA